MTNSMCEFSVPVSPSSAVECHLRRRVSINYSDSLLCHGGVTGSTTVRDAIRRRKVDCQRVNKLIAKELIRGRLFVFKQEYSENNVVSSLYQFAEPDTWELMREAQREVVVKVEDWDYGQSEEQGPDYAEERLYGANLEDLEAEKTLLFMEDRYYRSELGKVLDVVSVKLDKHIQENLAVSFAEMESLCGELNINIDEEYRSIKSCLEVLELEGGPLIYVPKHELIYAPQLILELNDDLIRKIARRPETIFEIPPRKFEEIIAEVFRKRGFEVELTKSTRDGGRDIIAIHDQMNVPIKYLIECKRYSPTNKISIGIVQRLFGVKMAEAANKAILATTSTFTRDARIFASKHVWDLDLKEYDDIMGWIKAHG